LPGASCRAFTAGEFIPVLSSRPAACARKKFLNKRLARRPMILPAIMEV
jgi:hypothetical protein